MSAENVALIGADPETFVNTSVKDNRGRHIRYEAIPAFGLFGGGKEEPKNMDGLTDGFKYLEDNAALEFNIPPVATSKEFVDAIDTAKSWMTTNLLEPKGMHFSESNLLVLTPKYQADPRALEVGCMPDHDAYADGQQRDPFNAAKLGDTRYAGGHIHLAYNCKVVPQYVAARFLDLYLTLPFLEYDRQQSRRQTYGMAGLFRPKDYGIEYRTMSNWWLWYGPGTLQAVAENALKFARNSYDARYLGLLSEAFVGMPWGDVKKAIDSEDRYAAEALIDLADRNYSLGIRSRR